MAAEPPLTPELLAKFGPLKAYPAGQRLDSSADPDRLVKTHCCFCGQQCGIQLKVKDNEVIGFEPWEDFPFNRGMLCPKGVRRYLQSSHHDRLTSAYFRDPSSPEGFRAVPYDEAVRRVASEIARIQASYGHDAFAVLGGASTPQGKRIKAKGKRKTRGGAFFLFPLSFFLEMCRLCMVSAAAANKKAFGVDRAGNPMSDIPLAEVIWIGGANVAECAPITTSYVWQARENGARIINVDPRITPLARTCDLILPIKPGRDAALFAGVLHLTDRERLARPRLPPRPHRRLRPGGRGGPGVDAAADGRGDRHQGARDPPGRRVGGDREDELPDARSGDGAARPRSQQLPGVDQHRAGVGPDRPARLLIVTLLVVLQLWLLTATMNAWLGGDSSVVWPAMLASLGCFLVNVWLLRRVFYLQGPGD